MRLIYFSIILAMFISACTPAATFKGPATPEPYRVIFTTGLNSDDKPINDLTQISINEKKIYIFIRWNLSISKHNILTVITDGAEKIVYRGQADFIPTSTDWNIWHWYNINPIIDHPGYWKFNVYLDGKKFIEKKLLVTPASNQKE